MFKLEIFSKTINKLISFNSNNRTISYIGTVSNLQMWNPLPKALAVNSKVIFVPNKTYVKTTGPRGTFDGIYTVELSTDRSSIRFRLVKFYESVSGSGQLNWVYYYGPTLPTPPVPVSVRIFEQDLGQMSNSYGLYLIDSTDYYSLSDSNKNGCVLWSFSGNIHSGFQLPSTIPNLNDCVIFANWNDLNYAVRVDDDNKIRIYNVTWQVTRAAPENTTVSLPIKLLAVASWENLPKSSPGLTIWGANGKITLSSDYPPLKVDKYLKYDFDSKAQPTITIGDPAVQYLIPISSSIGTAVVPITVYKTSSQAISFAMGNNTLRISQSAYLEDGRSNVQWTYFLERIPEFEVPLLKVDDYF